MMTSITRIFGVVLLAASLASCGGGGGGDNNAQNGNGADTTGATTTSTITTPTSGGAQSLSMTPATLNANMAVGTSVTTTVRISVVNGVLPDGIIYGTVRNGGAVFSDVVDIAVINANTVSATLHTLPTQVKGRQQGQLDIYLCNDAACSSPLAGAPLSASYNITVGDSSLQAYPIYSTAMSVHHGEALSKQVTVSVTGVNTSTSWIATSQQPWVTVLGGAGKGIGTFALGFKTESLAEGTQSAVVVVTAANGQTVDVPIQMQVLPVSFTSLAGTPTFAAVNGAPIPPQTLSFQLNNKLSAPWTATSTQPWMQVQALPGSSPATVSIEPNASLGNLVSGTYLADLVISSAGVPDMVQTTQLTLTPATLSSSSNTITLGGDKGRDLSISQSISLNLNTGANVWPYALGTRPDWLAASPLTGAVGEAGSAITMTVQGDQIKSGSQSATVIVQSQVNGDAVRLPLTVNVNVDQRRLLPSEWGVSFSSSPTGTTLSRTIAIRQNFGSALDWTASSDAAWLKVSSSGSTSSPDASNLVLTADPSLVPLEAVTYAKVTVSTLTSNVEPAVIRVALWRSATGLTTIKRVNATYYQIVADKLRPYVYAATATGVDVFNSYTGQKIGSVNGATGSVMPMSVSADGSLLYVLSVDHIDVIDLDTLTKVDTWLLVRPMSTSGPVLLAIQSPRINGVDVVLLNDGQAYARGRNVNKSLSFGFNGPMATSMDGSTLYDESARYGLDFSEMSGGMLFVNTLNYVSTGTASNLRDIAVASDGHHAYAAAGGGIYDTTGSGYTTYNCSAYDPTTSASNGTLPAEAYPNNVEVTRDGRVLCGVAQTSQTFDFRLYTANGVLIKSYRVGGGSNTWLRDGQLVATADGFTVAALTDDGYISFVPIGP